MTDDLVKRLRDFEQWMRDPEDQKFTLSSDLFDEAASRIEQLEGSKDRWKTAFLDLQKASEGISDLAMKYKEALREISHIHDDNPSLAMAGMPDVDYARFVLGEARRVARAALGEKKDG